MVDLPEAEEAEEAEAATRTATRTAAPAEAANGAEFVFSCVGNDDDLRSVTTARDGAFHGMAKGAVFIDNTTASAIVARELHAAATAELNLGTVLVRLAVHREPNRHRHEAMAVMLAALQTFEARHASAFIEIARINLRNLHKLSGGVTAPVSVQARAS